jgi:hypothetical protein
VCVYEWIHWLPLFTCLVVFNVLFVLVHEWIIVTIVKSKKLVDEPESIIDNNDIEPMKISLKEA